MTLEQKRALLEILKQCQIEFAGNSMAGYFENEWTEYLIRLVDLDIAKES